MVIHQENEFTVMVDVRGGISRRMLQVKAGQDETPGMKSDSLPGGFKLFTNEVSASTCFNRCLVITTRGKID